jgi:hypothetical protein
MDLLKSNRHPVGTMSPEGMFVGHLKFLALKYSLTLQINSMLCVFFVQRFTDYYYII